MHLIAVFWQPSAHNEIREFVAGEEWQEVLEQNCPIWTALAKIECEEWYGVFEVVDPCDYTSWIEIPELE